MNMLLIPSSFSPGVSYRELGSKDLGLLIQNELLLISQYAAAAAENAAVE
jgi:hypothetical protein